MSVFVRVSAAFASTVRPISSAAKSTMSTARRIHTLVKDEPDTDDREYNSKQDAQYLLGDARRDETTERNARQRSDKEGSEKCKIDRTHRQMRRARLSR